MEKYFRKKIARNLSVSRPQHQIFVVLAFFVSFFAEAVSITSKQGANFYSFTKLARMGVSSKYLSLSDRKHFILCP